MRESSAPIPRRGAGRSRHARFEIPCTASESAGNGDRGPHQLIHDDDAATSTMPMSMTSSTAETDACRFGVQVEHVGAANQVPVPTRVRARDSRMVPSRSGRRAWPREHCHVVIESVRCGDCPATTSSVPARNAHESPVDLGAGAVHRCFDRPDAHAAKCRAYDGYPS